MSGHRSHHRQLVVPDDADDCPCGSGEEYLECCKPHLPGWDIGKAAADARRQEDLAAALVATRADVAQYSVWHRTNTAPVMRSGDSRILKMVRIDVNALGEYVERVCEVLWRLGRAVEIGPMLERMRALIQHKWWQRKVTYLHAFATWMATDDAEAAKREFDKLGLVVADEPDLPILKLAAQLQTDRMSLVQALKIFDSILAHSTDLEDQIRFRGAKAARLMMHSDDEAAREELQAAAAAQGDAEDADLDWREQDVLSWCLMHLALISRDDAVFARAEALVHHQLDQAPLTDLGRARVHEHAGDLYRYWGRYPEAEAAYRTSLEFRDVIRPKIFLAESILAQGRAPDAYEVLRGLEPAHMTPPEYEDFLFTLAPTAIRLGDADLLQAVSKRLREHRGAAPYFEQRRLAFALAVEDAINQGVSAGLLERVRQLLQAPIRSLNRYVMLEPNISGVGVRVNNILEDAARVRPRRKHRRGK